KIDIHLGDEVVLFLFAWREKEFLSRDEAIRVAFSLHRAVRFPRQREFVETSPRLLNDRADRRLIFRIENDALIASGSMIQQHCFGDSAAATRQAQFEFGIAR